MAETLVTSEIRNDVAELLALLDPRVVNVMNNPSVWNSLSSTLVKWLLRNVSEYPWFNHLTLLSLIYAQAEIVDIVMILRIIHTFLKWAIPTHYVDIVSLKPVEALLKYFGDPPQKRGVSAYLKYQTIQQHTEPFFKNIQPEKYNELKSFLFPTPKVSSRLKSLNKRVIEETQKVRKKQTSVVSKRLSRIVALARIRYNWLNNLQAKVQAEVEAVKSGQKRLPVEITVETPKGNETVSFRIWDRLAWIEEHRSAYSERSLQKARQVGHSFEVEGMFLQLSGDMPTDYWFLKAIALGALQGSEKPSPEASKYQTAQGLPPTHVSHHYQGLWSPGTAMGNIFMHCRRTAAGTLEDSNIVFSLTPLLPVASIGTFCIATIATTGLRIGELMQITVDRECIEEVNLPILNDQTEQFDLRQPRKFLHVFPKGRYERVPCPINLYVEEMMMAFLKIFEKRHGHYVKSISALDHRHFKHARRFPGKHKFLLQWNGRQISSYILNKTIAFMLMENEFLFNANGEPINITSHLLRHGLAGWLRNQKNIPLDRIAKLLNHLNLDTTDYYSKLSEDEILTQFDDILHALADLVK